MNVLGASVLEDTATFGVWAPRCRSVDVAIEGRPPQPMRRDADGVFTATLGDLAPGTRYKYRLDGERYRPDPVSRWQPEGVHGASAVVDPRRFLWTDQDFRGHAPSDLVIYELHVGTFTAAGTFEAIVPHLPALADLGVTAVQLMPVAEFPGSRNWGYDGVHLYAPQSTYGGPRGLRRLVDACHAAGLSVFIDVVYNHLGPEGNYLAEYGPYFTDRYQTPWGPAVNFDGEGSPGVRRHIVENGRAWVSEFHVDGFRVDAVHAIHDASPVHIVTEFARAVREEAARAGRRVHVIAESHDNDRRLVLAPAEGGLGLDALWSDDFHHALHHRLTGETAGYYVDFTGDHHLPRAIAEGFAFQGEPSRYWGRRRGTASRDLPADRLVIYVQNHDQVGNRAQGERLGALVPYEALKLAAGLMFVTPAVPLLFMGEEYGDTAPFLFFTSFLDRELSERVRRGRLQELSRFGWKGRIPDPGAPATFVASQLNHALAAAPRHRALREYYRRWLALRRGHPALGARNKNLTRVALDAAVLTVTRATPAGEEIPLLANLGAEPCGWALPHTAGRPLLDRAAGRRRARPGAPAPRRASALCHGPRERAHRGRRARHAGGAPGRRRLPRRQGRGARGPGRGASDLPRGDRAPGPESRRRLPEHARRIGRRVERAARRVVHGAVARDDDRHRRRRQRDRHGRRACPASTALASGHADRVGRGRRSPRRGGRGPPGAPRGRRGALAARQAGPPPPARARAAAGGGVWSPAGAGRRPSS